MSVRSDAVKRTEDRIVQAARKLHSAQGIVATSYDDIGSQAGISATTVYRHFPSLAHLLPACASSIPVLQEITQHFIEALFASLDQPQQRIEHLVRGTCDCYRRDGGWLAAARGEQRSVPELQQIAELQTRNLRILVDAALGAHPAGARTRQRIAALIDFPVWQALTAAGFDVVEATEEMLQLVMDQLAKTEDPGGEQP